LIEQAPDPRGSPQLPHGAGDVIAARFEEPVCAAKTES